MSDTPARSGPIVVTQLSVMMFLQFFLWGAWFVTLGPFMGAMKFGSVDIANAYTTAPIAAILSPFFLGIIADRFFPSQRVMGVLHVLGGALLLLAPTMAAKGAEGPWPFIGILLAHMICYMPTLGLSNAVAFHAMHNPEKQFPIVRVWGTIGWIVAGLLVGWLMAKQAKTEGLTAAEAEAARASVPVFFYIAGGSGILLGLFSFVLPNTPAPSKGKPVSFGSIVGIDSLRLLKQRSFAVFILCSMLICIPLAAYYSFAGEFATQSGVQNVPIKMTFGQMSEIFFMLVMPFFFIRLGVKWMLAVGMLAWIVRYGLFSIGWGADSTTIAQLIMPDGSIGNLTLPWASTACILGGIVLHGICYDFFFVTGQIYTERTAPPEVRAQAQGFLVLVTQGIGMLIGNQVFGRLVAHYTTGPEGAHVTNWKSVWAIPAGFALLVLLIFVVLFKGRGNAGSMSGAGKGVPSPELEASAVP
ncbi:MAG: MFS transporter [Phycisphaerales bacterium]